MPGIGVGVAAGKCYGAPSGGDTAPSAPLNFVATDAGSDYDLTWDTPASDGGDAITSYKVYKNAVLLDTVAAPTTSLDAVAAVAFDELYVTAVNGVGESAPSNVETIPDEGDPGVFGFFGKYFGNYFRNFFGGNRS